MNRSYWYKYGMIVYWKPIYGKNFIGDAWVVSRPGDPGYTELAESTHDMLPKSLEVMAAKLTIKK